MIEQPAQVLAHIADAVRRWLGDNPNKDASAAEWKTLLSRMSVQVEQLQRNLAETGLTPQQLENLGNVLDDALLSRELSLLALEANWQLSALVQSARRLWPRGKESECPAALLDWVAQVEDLTDPLLARRGMALASDLALADPNPQQARDLKGPSCRPKIDPA